MSSNFAGLLKRLPVFLFLVFSLRAEENLYDWSKTPELFPGIKHVFLDTDKPRTLKINVIQVDLSRKDLRFMTVDRDPDWGKPMPDYDLPIRVRRKTVRDFMLDARARGIDMLVAVNATPWIPWKPPYTHVYGAKLGLVISNGVLVDSPNGRPVFLITKQNEFQIRQLAKNEDLSKIQLALTGFEIILKDGKVLPARRSPNPAPRTAYGLSSGNRCLLIIVVDGRMKLISEGVNTAELGELMRYFGAEVAINMDGGGSSTLMVYDGKDGIRQLNKNPFLRRVASSLGIYRDKPDGEKTGKNNSSADSKSDPADKTP